MSFYELAVLSFVGISCVMIDHLLFISANMPIQFVNKSIDGGVHVFFSCIGINSTAVNAYSCFCLMS